MGVRREPSPDLPPRPPADIDHLQDVPFTIAGRFGDASNATMLVHLGDGPIPEIGPIAALEAGTWGVYKPRDGEAPLWDFTTGTLYRREVAAFIVDRALGWGMVPATVVREDGPLGVGSLQLFVPHDPDRHLFTLMQDEVPTPAILRQVERMVVLDTIIENADRKAGHVLADQDDRLWLVDHGVCFHEQPHLRTVAWHLAGEPVNDDDRRDVARLADELAVGAALDRDLTPLLDHQERQALRARAQALARPGACYPHPRVERPIPWPPI